ncbi:methylglutaconyl-CoA hydratase [Pedobacter sp. UYP30]|uniref:enoyl-CoA hydratase/isomerase family protein n=1 Tax=Pedobacter sp. UYP30 TaxID=1756400 RepID=UPI003397A13A
MNLIKYEVNTRIGTITLNRPEKSNALNPELISALTDTFKNASEDKLVKVIVLKAAGNSFSAGADLAYLQTLETNSYDENLADSRNLKNLFAAIYYSPKIVIAQVEGYAIAGGCGLATVCDFIFATPESHFGYTEVKIGFVPAIVSCFLPQKIGETLSKELLYTGKIISADEALNCRLINFVTNSTEINQKVHSFALHLCENSSESSLTATKKLINKNIDSELEIAIKMNASIRETNDFKKGIKAFLNKQKINW